MPKVQAEFKKNKIGKMAIKLDRFHYSPGDTINGTVFFDCTQQAVCDGLVLKFTGKEEAEWDDRRTRFVEGEDGEQRAEHYYEHLERKHPIFKSKSKLSPDGWVCSPGQYQFPFSIQIPAHAPGSLDLKWGQHGADRDIEVEVQYKLKATLDVAGKGMKDLKAKIPVTVFVRPASEVRPATGQNTSDVLVCCCINKGSVTMNATFDKNAYMPGEVATIMLSTTNNSSVDVGRVKVKLMRLVNLRVKEQTKRIFEEMARSTHNGVPAGESVENQHLQLQIPRVTPSSDANLAQCIYRIDVECDLPMAPDIEIQLPVQIYAAEPQIPVVYLHALAQFGQ